MRASWADDEDASSSGTPAGVAVIWLVFYGLIFAGWLGSEETRHVSRAYADLQAAAAASRAIRANSIRAITLPARTVRAD